MNYDHFVHQLDSGKWTVGAYDESSGTWTRPMTDAEQKSTGCHTVSMRCGRDVNMFAAYHGPQLASKQSAIRFAKRVYGNND